MGRNKWMMEDMPSLKGKITLVTEANSGLGFYTTKALPGKGALPSLYAATSPDVIPSGFYGPDGIMSLSGYPVPSKQPGKKKMNRESARKPWEISEELTGVSYMV